VIRLARAGARVARRATTNLNQTPTTSPMRSPCSQLLVSPTITPTRRAEAIDPGHGCFCCQASRRAHAAALNKPRSPRADDTRSTLGGGAPPLRRI